MKTTFSHDISYNIYRKSNTAKNTVSIGLFKVNLLRNCVRMKMGFFKKRTKGGHRMSRKKIALLVAQADEEYQSDFVRGAMKKAFSAGVDLYVFSMYIKYQNTRGREIGDANIYNVINYSQFDGIIILSDMMANSTISKL